MNAEARTAAAGAAGALVRTRFALLLIALTAFAVRLLHVLSWDPWPTGSMAVHVEMAAHCLTFENLFSAEGACPLPPGYALFLKPFLLFLEPASAFTAVRVSQAALGALTCLLVYRLARRLHSRRAGLAAALMTCFFHHFLFYSSVYMSENLFIPLWLAALLAFLRARQKGGAGRLYSAGLLAGAAMLVRPAAISLAPAALAAAGASPGAPATPHRPARRLLRGLAPVVAGGLSLLAPWSLRSGMALGSPVLVEPGTALDFAVGNTAEATGWHMEVATPGLAGADRDAELRARATGSLTGDPWGALYVTLRLKWNAFWAGIPPWPLHDGNPSLFAGGLFFPVLSWRLVLASGLAGLGLLIVRKPREAILTGACAAAYVACHLAFSGQPRFRMPLEALFLAWAGAVLAALAPKRRFAAAGPLAVCLILVAILTEASAAGVIGRTGRSEAADLIAHGPPLRFPAKERVVPLFGADPLRLDRSRGRYLRLSLMARRSGPPRATPANGALKITFLNDDGAPRPWANSPVLRLDALPPDRWAPIEIKHHIPPDAVAARVEMIPDPASPDTLRLDQISLRYARGNDLALEFLFPYLRYSE